MRYLIVVVIVDKMSKSKTIALCAVSTAFALVFLIIGAYIPDFDLSCIFMASLCMMLPLTKQSLKGAFLTYSATVLLSFLLTGIRLQVIIPFTIFFGLHPIVNYIIFTKIKRKFGKLLSFFIKALWFIGTLYVTYYFTQMFIGINEKIERYIEIIIPIVGFLFFIVYDYIMIRFQITANYLIHRLKL